MSVRVPMFDVQMFLYRRPNHIVHMSDNITFLSQMFLIAGWLNLQMRSSGIRGYVFLMRNRVRKNKCHAQGHIVTK